MSGDEMNTEQLAEEILALWGSGAQTSLMTSRFPSFRLSEAYAVGAAIQRRRHARGEVVVGRKIGFTNHLMWEKFGVRAPMWAAMYDTTVDWAYT